MPARQLRTWTGETYDCAAYLEPESEEALADAIRAAREVRFIGAGHSMIERIVPRAGGTLIDLRRFREMTLPDAPPTSASDDAVATVGAGVPLDVLSDALAARGWALAILPTQPTVTVAGAISMGSHNTAREGSALLADEVLAIDALDAAGRRVRFEGRDLEAARVGLGALGAIVRVALRCIPAFELIHELVDADADATFDGIDALRARHDHLWLYWKLLPNGDERVVVRTADRADGEVRRAKRLTAMQRVPRWQQIAAHALTSFAARVPSAKRALMGSISPRKPVMGASHHVFFEHLDWLQGQDASIAIPVERLPEARVALRAAFRAAGYQPNLPLLVRFLPASDKTLLGMNAGRAVAQLELMSLAAFTDFEVGRRVFCDVLAAFSPRFHWAKGATGDVARSFPDATWRTFEAVRAKIDPSAKFVSPWLRSVLPMPMSSMPIAETGSQTKKRSE